MIACVISIDDNRYAQFLSRLPNCIENIQRVSIPPTGPDDKPSWYTPSAGCWSLTRAIIFCLESGLRVGEPVLMFEDDACFVPDFEVRYNRLMNGLPPDWDSLYLGGQLRERYLLPPLFVEGHPYILDGRSVRRTHAWTANVKAIPRILDAFLRPKIVSTCDVQLANLHFEPDFDVYIPSGGWLCGQGENDSHLTGLHEPERWWPWTFANCENPE